MPRAAKYSVVAANCAGLPVAQLPVWSKNPICMESKDDGGRVPGGLGQGVTPRYMTKNHLVTLGIAPSKPA
jgi:hypothetical protein